MLESIFSSVIERYRAPESQLVLALSGGIDSRVLLDLLADYRRKFPQLACKAVYVHHGLSEQADEWATQCQKWCDGYAIELAVERVTLHITPQVSVEQEARDKRYQALRKHIGTNDLLLTAQHGDDQLETFLLAMKRGSGPKGLASMPECTPFSQGYLVRPLLGVSQESITNYATSKALTWVEDESNTQTKYDRNFLRLEVIPKLKQRWPSIDKTVLRSSQLCAEQEALLHELLSDKLDSCLTGDGSLSIELLAQQSEKVRNQLLRHWLEKRSALMPTLKQLPLIWQEVALARQDANPKLVLASGEVRRYQQRLYFIDKSVDLSDWSEILTLDKTIELPASLGSLALRKTTIRHQFSLRSPKPDEQVWLHFNPQGLSAHPAERGHSRKLKKLFQEYKVPSWLRTQTPIVMYGDSVAMVADCFVCTEYMGEDCEIVWDKV